MQNIDLVKFYKSLFKQHKLYPVATFQKFRQEVSNYIKDVVYGLNRQIAAILVAKKYKKKQHQHIQFNKIASNLNRQISITGTVEILSDFNTFESPER